MLQIQKSYQSSDQLGKLYLVGTPIGNLEDMTFRAVRILREVQWIAAEDTRQTKKLLSHYEISNTLVSYHEHNKTASGPELVKHMLAGQSVALVSDAGMPAISDPGYELVRDALNAGIAVIPVPGANAAISALVASGLPTDRFLFAGFLSRSSKAIKEELSELKAIQATVVLYESPHRIVKTLRHIGDNMGNRHIALARELTKRYEEMVRGPVEACLAWLEEHPPVGEYCIVISRDPNETLVSNESLWWVERTLEEHVQAYEEQGMERKEAMKKAATDRGISKRDVYQQLMVK